jgi:hypothetical protein
LVDGPLRGELGGAEITMCGVRSVVVVVDAHVAGELDQLSSLIALSDAVLDRAAASAQDAIDSLAYCTSADRVNDLVQHPVARIGRLADDLDGLMRPHLDTAPGS